MSKLLVSCGTLGAGGAERVLSTLSPYFADNFDDVIYLMWVKHPVFYQIDSRVRLVCMPDKSGFKNRYCEMPWFRRFVRDVSPDVVLSFLSPFNILVSLSLIGTKQKLVLADRNDPSTIKGGPLMSIIRNILYNRADAILTQTFAFQKYYPTRLRKKMHVIYNPISLPQDMVGCAYKCGKEDIIVTAGRLIPVKNHGMLIDAFKLFVETHPTYRLVIYGDGECRNELIDYVECLGLKDKVSFPGSVKDLWNQTKRAKVFALTSDHEGMPNALVEAMSLGLPCVSTRIAAAEELIEDGVNGRLVDVGDTESLKNTLCEMVDNRNYASKIGDAASHLYDQLDVNIIAEKWISLLKSILTDIDY